MRCVCWPVSEGDGPLPRHPRRPAAVTCAFSESPDSRDAAGLISTWNYLLGELRRVQVTGDRISVGKPASGGVVICGVLLRSSTGKSSAVQDYQEI